MYNTKKPSYSWVLPPLDPILPLACGMLRKNYNPFALFFHPNDAHPSAQSSLTLILLFFFLTLSQAKYQPPIYSHLQRYQEFFQVFPFSYNRTLLPYTRLPLQCINTCQLLLHTIYGILRAHSSRSNHRYFIIKKKKKNTPQTISVNAFCARACLLCVCLCVAL